MTAIRLSAISQVVLSVRLRMLSSAPRYSLPNGTHFYTMSILHIYIFIYIL